MSTYRDNFFDLHGHALEEFVAACPVCLLDDEITNKGTDVDNSECSGEDEVGVDWIAGLVIHEGDADWHPWDPNIYGEAEESR